MIRLATVEDIPLLVRLRTEFLEELRGQAHPGVLPGQLSAANLEPSTAEYYARALPSGQFAAWLAEEGGEAAGMAGIFYFERPPMEKPGGLLEGRIVNVFTRPAFRGRGLGTELTRCAVEHARARGARRVRLGAAEGGRRIYERLGFTPVSAEMELRFTVLEVRPAEGGDRLI